MFICNLLGVRYSGLDHGRVVGVVCEQFVKVDEEIWDL